MQLSPEDSNITKCEFLNEVLRFDESPYDLNFIQYKLKTQDFAEVDQKHLEEILIRNGYEYAVETHRRTKSSE